MPRSRSFSARRLARSDGFQPSSFADMRSDERAVGPVWLATREQPVSAARLWTAAACCRFAEGAATARIAHSPKHALLAAWGGSRRIANLLPDPTPPAARVHVSTNARNARGCEAKSGSRLAPRPAATGGPLARGTAGSHPSLRVLSRFRFPADIPFSAAWPMSSASAK